MLRIPNDKVRHCYQRATDCRREAINAHDPKYRASMLKMEERWLRLAQSYQLTETISDFSTEVRRYLGRK